MKRTPSPSPMAEKLDLLRRSTEQVKKNPKVFGSAAMLSVRSEDKYFASSEGSSIQQLILQIYGNIDATAVDRDKNISRTRNYTPTQASAGWEYVPEMNLEENAGRIREEVLEHLSAPAVKPGRKDLILMPNHLMLTIHESVAHPTELDRALGYEANYAGTSYITPDKIGKRIASEQCTFIGDRTSPALSAPLATMTMASKPRSSPSSIGASSATTKPPANRPISSVTRNHTAAARPTPGPPSPSSACPTSGSKRAPPKPRSTA